MPGGRVQAHLTAVAAGRARTPFRIATERAVIAS
jgi:hypothetical protein